MKDRAGNSYTNSITFSVITFDPASNLVTYADYNEDTKLDIAGGSKEDETPIHLLATDGYLTNCIRPGNNGMDEGALYSSENNIFDSKGTLSVWLKPDWNNPGSDEHYIFSLKNSKDASLSVYSICGYVSANGTVFSIKNKNNTEFTIETEKEKPGNERWYYPKTWTHLVFTWDFSAGKMAVYINGAKAGEKIITGEERNNSKKLWVGAGRWGGFDMSEFKSFKGRVDELGIYSYYMNENEAYGLYTVSRK